MYLGEGPACHDLAWYLALNRRKLPTSKEQVIADFRTALERDGIDTGPWWDRQLRLALLGAVVQQGWEKALGDDDEWRWWCDRAGRVSRCSDPISRMTGVAVAQLRIRLLGGFVVDGLNEHEIGSRKGRTVLKVLALARGAPVSTDRLVDVLWGDELPSRPTDQVGVLVSRLRAVIGSDRLPRTEAGYSLRYDWLDLDELDARVAEAERRHAAGQESAARAAADAALALLRGPLLPEEEGEWVVAERVAADRGVDRARAVLAESALDAGDHGAAMAAAEVLLTSDPYNEAALENPDACARRRRAAGEWTRGVRRAAQTVGGGPRPVALAGHRGAPRRARPR